MPKWVFRALCVFPVTAILHHVIFYPPTCILNSFGGNVALWLRRDPSLPYGALVVVALWRYVSEQVAMRFFLAFLPLTIWLWDIPFTDRWVHRVLHDGHAKIGNTVLHTHHFYMLGVLLFVASFTPELVRRLQAGKKATREGVV